MGIILYFFRNVNRLFYEFFPCAGGKDRLKCQILELWLFRIEIVKYYGIMYMNQCGPKAAKRRKDDSNASGYY